jgi:hypothetical protein
MALAPLSVAFNAGGEINVRNPSLVPLTSFQPVYLFFIGKNLTPQVEVRAALRFFSYLAEACGVFSPPWPLPIQPCCLA